MLKIKKLILRIFVLTILSTLCSCSIFEPSFEPFTSPPIETSANAKPAVVQKETTEVNIQPLLPTIDSHADSIRIKWLVPNEPIDGYIIRYGFNSNQLDYEERVRWDQLKIEDVQNRKLFVHQLERMPISQTVYLSIAAIKDDRVSQSTQIYTIKPESH